MPETLDELRSRLNELDRELIDRVAERQEVTRKIGLRKSEQGLPTRDFLRERQVVEHVRETADRLGLSQDVIETLFRHLIQASLESQEADRIAGTGRDGNPVLVIGGAGKMGSWFARFLASQGYCVEIADTGAEESEFRRRDDWHEHVESYEIIVVATPINATNGILRELETLEPPGLVFDVSSLKGPLRGSLLGLSDAGLKITSLHPMFGPDTTLLSDRHVIFVDVGNREATEQAKTIFEPTMAKLVEMSLEDHDRMIAYVLGLSHALNIAFFTALRESGEAAERLATMSSTTFDAQLKVARKVSSENPELYFEIQSLNDYRIGPLNALQDALSRVQRLIETNNEDGFAKLMEKGRQYLRSAGETGAAVEAGSREDGAAGDRARV